MFLEEGTSLTHLQPLELGLQVLLHAAAQYRRVGRYELFRGWKAKKCKRSTHANEFGVSVDRALSESGLRAKRRTTTTV